MREKNRRGVETVRHRIISMTTAEARVRGISKNTLLHLRRYRLDGRRHPPMHCSMQAEYSNSRAKEGQVSTTLKV
jgi:hypothetical protein